MSEPFSNLHITDIQIMPEVRLKLVGEGVVIPFLATPGSSGYDLYHYPSQGNVIIPVHGRFTFHVGFHMALPAGFEAQVRPRSGLAQKGIVGHFGTIDSDYRGEACVILHNLSRVDVTVDLTKAIGQMVFCRVFHPDFRIVSELSSTERGSGGFGSTDEK
jgi:dUTP pyrophosphatase